MAKIKLLDNLTIQKIAAGEIIERPASIVKELVENSLDANGKNIVIEISEGGKSLIRITDDGDGIGEEDLELAFKRHSTSKLSSIEDIYNIMSLGFRGEALASVSTVSKVEVLTKTNSSTAGIQAIVEEGKVLSKNVVGCPKGTTMIIRDLFYNLPVRKKFLRSDLSEGNHISDIVYKLALGNYNTAFKFIRDGKVVLRTSNNKDIKENIYTILGKDISNNLIPIDYNKNGLKIKGYISNNHLYRSNRSHQYLYINGRYIVNYGISSVIENQYKSLIPLNRFPVYILYVDMNPNEIDVNIHPTKQEIKFINNTDIIGIIGNLVKDILFPSIQIPKVELTKSKGKVEVEELPLLFEEPIKDKFKDIVIKDFTLEKSNNKDNIDFINENLETISFYDSVDIILENHDTELNDDLIENLNIENLSIENHSSIEVESTNDNYPDSHIKDIFSNVISLGVVFGTYILGEDRENGKLFFIDQHAAHERIMYEKYKKEFENDEVNTQQLLIPEIVDLTNKEMTDVVENINLFKKLGFDIEEFGLNSIAIRGVPMVFGEPNIKGLFMDLLDNIKYDIKSSYDTKIDKIMKLACSKAIKSGDRLSSIEIMALLKDLSACDVPYTCPHGRPTIMEMTKKDIEKEFLRIT